MSLTKNKDRVDTNHMGTSTSCVGSLPKKKDDIDIIMWKALFLMADQYPDEPNIDTINNCNAFINTLPYMLPADHDGYNLKSFIVNYRQNNPHLCDSQKNLAKFFVNAYNSNMEC